MITLLLQIVGGLCYFSNKVFFAAAERTNDEQYKQRWRIAAWIVYLLGVTPWVTIFISEHNWVAAAVESSGVPAMLMGLINVLRKEHDSSISHLLDIIAKIMIVAGLGISLYDFGGITSFNQVIELGIAAGFLFGTYCMAKSSSAGYVWLLFGNMAAALLMMRQGYYILMAQQLLSMIPVSYALRSHCKKVKTEKGYIQHQDIV